MVLAERPQIFKGLDLYAIKQGGCWLNSLGAFDKLAKLHCA